MKRFAAIWFPHLCTDWFANRNTVLKQQPFVLTTLVRGKMMVTAANIFAQQQGIKAGMSLADARTFVPNIAVLDNKPDLAEKLLHKLALWCIRYTPVAAVDLPDGLLLDISGCAHLWGGEQAYLQDINNKLLQLGYGSRIAIADTVGGAWAVGRFGQKQNIVAPGELMSTLLPLPPEALRLEPAVAARLHKLGLNTIGAFIHMQPSALRRRFGAGLLLRIDQALGTTAEIIEPVHPIAPYQERLPCLEPVLTRKGIELATEKLLQTLCDRLQNESNGLRSATLTCHRSDGTTQQISIGTHEPSNNVAHLFALFTLKMDTIAPAMGIELFVLEAAQVQEAIVPQTALWKSNGNIEDTAIAELLDRIKSKLGDVGIHRFLPDEHYWTERSFREATSLHEKSTIAWPTDKPRPIYLLPKPQPIKVTAPIPDYPPMLFIYQNKLYKVVKADGPERMEREWWLDGPGLHRDYYCVEDETGNRYWLFRLGHYDGQQLPQWFLHGFFA